MTLYLTTKIRQWKERAAEVEGSWLENKMAALAQTKPSKQSKKIKETQREWRRPRKKDARAESTVSPFQYFLYTINNLFINAWIC